MVPSSNEFLAGLQGTYLADNGGVLLYPASGSVESADSRDDFVSPERQKELRDPAQIPAVKQPVINRSDPDAKILEKVGQTFKDATDFVAHPPEEGRDRASLR